MRAYECLYIIHPAADSNELDGSAKKYGGIIEGKGGTVRKADIWGKRQLAYPIKNFSDGNYVLLRFDAPPAAIKDLEFRMRVDDRILRYMTSYEVAEGAGQSDELMQLTERKERDRRGRGRGRGGGRFGGRRYDRDGGRGPRERPAESRPESRPAAKPAEAKPAGGSDVKASAPATAETKGSDPRPSEGGSE